MNYNKSFTLSLKPNFLFLIDQKIDNIQVAKLVLYIHY